MNTLAECVETAMSVIEAEGVDLSACGGDPKRIAAALGLSVVEAPHLAQERGDGGACDGMSFLDDKVLLYAPTPYNRRENFTISHEIGHWLIDQVDEIFDWLLEQEDAAKVHETLCDKIARRLLLDEATITAVIGAGPLEVAHIKALYNATNASVPACMIALSEHLTCVGAIAAIDPDTWTVTDASVHPDLMRGWPVVTPWPGQQVPDIHPLRNLTLGNTLQRRSFWKTSWGQREEFYIDAIHEPRRILVVFAADDLWHTEVFHAPTERSFDERPERTTTCCGQTRTVRGYPCATCNEGYCRECGKCRCDRRASAESKCQGRCGLIYLPHLLHDGYCDDCA